MYMKNVLIEKPGYLKTGTNRLCAMLGMTRDEVKQLRKDAIKHFGTPYPKVEKEQMHIKQKWVKSNGAQTVHYSNQEVLSKDSIQEAIINALSTLKVDVTYIDSKTITRDNVAVLSIPDVHIGQYCKELSFQDQVKQYKEVALKLFSDIIASDCYEVIFPIGSDYFNVDTKQMTTSNYTQQHNAVNWKEMYSEGLKAVIEVIMHMSRYANVTVICTPGNHDEVLSYTMMQTMRMLFIDNENVNFLESDNFRTYIKRGVNLFGFTHGKDEKPATLPNLMAYEAREMWGTCKYMDYFHGHHHTEVLKDVFGVRIIGLPSLALPNEWAKQKGYVSNNGAKAYIYSETLGPIKYIQTNI